jgi:hypothetical protein
VLGKLNRKAMKRTLVQAGYKTLNNLPGKQFQVGQLPYIYLQQLILISIQVLRSSHQLFLKP